MSVSSSNFTFVLFKTACHINPNAERIWVGSSPYILRHIFPNFKIHQLAIIYCFERTSDIYLNFLFQLLRKPFLRACNVHQQYLPCLVYSNLFRVIMFIRFFRIIHVFVWLKNFDNIKINSWISWSRNLYVLVKCSFNSLSNFFS